MPQNQSHQAISRKFLAGVLVVGWFGFSCVVAHAAPFDDAANGNYNVNGTWGGSANPGGGAGNDTVTLNSNTVTITTGSDASTDIITITNPGILAASDFNNAFLGSAINLNGGTLRFSNHTANRTVGGDITVNSSSLFEFNATSAGTTSPTLTFGTLNFGTGNPTLTFTKDATDRELTAKFVGSTFTNSGVLVMNDATPPTTGRHGHVELNGISGGAGIVVGIQDLTPATASEFRVTGTNVGTFLGKFAVSSNGRLVASNVDALNGATVDVNSGGLFIANADNSVQNTTVNVFSGGKFRSGENVANAFSNAAAINLEGGIFAPFGNGSRTVSGNVTVNQSSTMQLEPTSSGSTNVAITLGKLDFGPGNPTLTVNNSPFDRQMTGTFVDSTFTNSGVITFDDTASTSNRYAHVELNGVSGGSGVVIGVQDTTPGTFSTVTVTGNNTGTFMGIFEPSSGGVLQSGSADAMNGATIVVKAGGTLQASSNGLDDAFRGANIVLENGTFRPANIVSTAFAPGGNITVNLSSTIAVTSSVSGGTPTSQTFGSLDFGPGNPTLTMGDNLTRSITSIFVNSVITNSGTILTPATATNYDRNVDLNGLAVTAGETLTTTGGSATATTRLNNVLGTRLRGSGDLLATDGVGGTLQIIDHVSGTTDYNLTSLDTSGGLWNYFSDATTTAALNLTTNNQDAYVTLDAGTTRKGTLDASTTTSTTGTFAAEDAGSIQIDNLMAGTSYALMLELANISDINDVVSEMLNNDLWTTVVASAGDEVTAEFVGPFNGTGFFAWDNLHGLGADVTQVSITNLDAQGDVVPEPETIAIWMLLGLVGAGYALRHHLKGCA